MYTTATFKLSYSPPAASVVSVVELPPQAASPKTAAAVSAKPLMCFFIYLLSPYANRIAIVGSPRRLARPENNTVNQMQNR